MSDTATSLQPVAVMEHEPRLLIEWESPWEAFRTALAPAMARSGPRLEGECRAGMFPLRGMVASWLMEVAVLELVITLPATLLHMRRFEPPPRPKYDVLYFSGDYLPQTTDAGGAETGHTGKAGGREALNPRQTVRISRGDSLANKVVDAPKLKLPRTDENVANLLAFAAAQPGPPPTVGLPALSKPKLMLPEDAIAPAPQVTRDKLTAAAALNASAVAPAPEEVKRDRLSAATQVETRVVPPAPVVPGEVERVRLPQIAENAVPPPVSAPPRDSTTTAKLMLPPPSVVQPPADTSLAHEVWSMAGSLFGGGTKEVVPPPVQVSGGSLTSHGYRPGIAGGTGTDIVPPAPDVTGTGSGSGNGGKGATGSSALASLGSPNVVGPNNGGSGGTGTGVVVSSQPGSKFGVPGEGGTGSLAMSPSGGGNPGLGGRGGGAGTGNGEGSGSGKTGEGSGAGATGTGFGASTTAHGGIAPGPGRGGAGKGAGNPSMAGVSISGGGVVNLPSFAMGGSAPNIPGKMPSERERRNPSITIVATPRSGGALNLYGEMKGDKVYTIYIDTHPGVAVLQFSDPDKANGGFNEDLTPPEPVRAELPSTVAKNRIIVACTMDRSGILRDLKPMPGAKAHIPESLMAALGRWRFRPVLRGADPIEVNAVLGFNIDTRDVH